MSAAAYHDEVSSENDEKDIDNEFDQSPGTGEPKTDPGSPPSDPVQVELKLLRQAYQEQGKALGALQQHVQRIAAEVSVVATDIAEIKRCLNGHLKPT